MATLIDAAEYTLNEVYKIDASDPVEGAAVSASFNGTGISNQPHQQLANRTAFLKQRQDVNISSIGVLQAFMAGFVGKMQANGYLNIPILDVNRGPLAAMVQWGSLMPSGGLNDEQIYTITWPQAFANTCVWAMCGLAEPTGDAIDVSPNPATWQVVRFTRTQGIFQADVPGGGAVPGTGFYWLSIGF